MLTFQMAQQLNRFVRFEWYKRTAGLISCAWLIVKVRLYSSFKHIVKFCCPWCNGNPTGLDFDFTFDMGDWVYAESNEIFAVCWQ